MRYRMIAVGALVLTTGAAAAGCARSAPADAPRAETPVSVTTVTVHLSDGQDRAEIGGTLRGRASVVLSSRLLASVSRILVAPGDRVRAGQVLVQLDDRDLSAGAAGTQASAVAAERGLTRAEGELAAVEAAAVLARASHARVAALQARRSATLQELDEATAALAGAEARVTSARAGVEQARASLDAARAAATGSAATAAFARIVSPIDGIVTEKFVEVGQMVAPGAEVARVEDVSSLELLVRVDESRGAGVTVGASLDAVIDTPAGPVPTTGRVTEVARASDSDTRTLLLRIAIPAAPGLRPGAFGRARLPGPAARLLLVPATALVRNGQVSTVFVVADGKARVRLVRTGDTIGADVAIVAGLSDGESVVVNPAPGVRDGVAVVTGARR